MPKPHKSGLATTAEANVVGRYLVASHSYTLSGEHGKIEDVEAVSFNKHSDALAFAKKLAANNPGDKIYIFQAEQEVSKADFNIVDLT